METCTTVHDLPPEVLQHWHANLWDTSDIRKDWKLLFFWETTLLHICKSWTALAKGYPDLWSHIHFPLAAEQLDRPVALSLGVSLKVFGSSWLSFLNKGAFLEFPERLKPVCSRIASLEFRGVLSPLQPLLSEWQLTSHGAASLTCLVLHATGESTASDRSNGDALVKLLQSFCPRLLELRLNSYYPLRLKVLPSTLQVLTLHCAVEHPRPLEPGYLESLSNLRVLELSRQYIRLESPSHPTEDEFHHQPPIELPNLEALSLEDASPVSIQTALALKIQWKFMDLESDYSDLHNMLSWMCQCVEGVHGDSLQLSCRGDDSAHIVLNWNRSWSDDSDPVFIHLDLEKTRFTIPESKDMVASYAKVMDFVLQLCRSVSSETLSSVDMRFSGAYMLTTDDWIYAFGDPSLTEIEELKVYKGTFSQSLLDALTGTKDSGDGMEDLFMPSLRRLQLTKVVFERMVGDVDIMNGLHAMLLRRRECGAGIVKLTLRKCIGITEEDHAQLKELVPELCCIW
ncbi:hypothetical protein DL96DRAFT_1579746 [Flagelloscypha sp. PMI_526]|nr:hypothetical protein DL96DRAFT_1579746 [Flagelloscypha sp. PMI_526]